MHERLLTIGRGESVCDDAAEGSGISRNAGSARPPLPRMSQETGLG